MRDLEKRNVICKRFHKIDKRLIRIKVLTKASYFLLTDGI